MYYMILGFGILILLSGLLILINPNVVFNLLRNNLESLSLYAIAITVRLVLGIVLIAYATVSKFPIIFQILGWLSIIAAVFLGAMGRPRFQQVLLWVTGIKPVYARFTGILAMLFGGFLIYAIV